MPRVPGKIIEHGNGDDWHETIDSFDSHARILGEARSDVFMPDPSEEQIEEWAAEQADRDRRRRPLGFTAWRSP